MRRTKGSGLARVLVALSIGVPFLAATPVPEPSVPFGRVIYRSAKVAGIESLGVTMIACRHRDPTPRRFAVQFFDRTRKPVTLFGAKVSPPIPAGKKVVLVTDRLHFVGRDVVNLSLGHLQIGSARVISDAEIVHCVGKMRMDAGVRSPSYRDEIGLTRDGRPVPQLGEHWRGPRATPRPTPRP